MLATSYRIRSSSIFCRWVCLLGLCCSACTAWATCPPAAFNIHDDLSISLMNEWHHLLCLQPCLQCQTAERAEDVQRACCKVVEQIALQPWLQCIQMHANCDYNHADACNLPMQSSIGYHVNDGHASGIWAAWNLQRLLLCGLQMAGHGEHPPARAPPGLSFSCIQPIKRTQLWLYHATLTLLYLSARRSCTSFGKAALYNQKAVHLLDRLIRSHRQKSGFCTASAKSTIHPDECRCSADALRLIAPWSLIVRHVASAWEGALVQKRSCLSLLM